MLSWLRNIGCEKWKHLQAASTNRLVTGEVPFLKYILNLMYLCKFWIVIINLSLLRNMVNSKLHLLTVSQYFSIGRPVRIIIALYPIGRPVRATITVYFIGRPVRATIPLCFIGRPVRATFTMYPIGRLLAIELLLHYSYIFYRETFHRSQIKVDL